MAIRWKLEHGSYPKKLSDSQLAENVPKDVWSGEELRIATVTVEDGEAVRIYSVGSNGVDDHGRWDKIEGWDDSYTELP